MNRYSRINSKSKSVPTDSSDHLSFPITQTPPKISKPHEEKCNKNEKCVHEEMNGEEGDGEMFGVILSRSRSAASYKSMEEKERRCSMKRSSSSSVASGYCRIHHQNDEETKNLNVLHRKKEKGKILRACMRLLGF